MTRLIGSKSHQPVIQSNRRAGERREEKTTGDQIRTTTREEFTSIQDCDLQMGEISIQSQSKSLLI